MDGSVNAGQWVAQESSAREKPDGSLVMWPNPPSSTFFAVSPYLLIVVGSVLAKLVSAVTKLVCHQQSITGFFPVSDPPPRSFKSLHLKGNILAANSVKSVVAPETSRRPWYSSLP